MEQNRLSDLHLHTTVSDGEMTLDDILQTAARLGLSSLAITDHDAVGAYGHFDADPFGKAAALRVHLLSGIELDSEWHGREVHVLGYGIDLAHAPLRAHLRRVQEQRRRRVREQIRQINDAFGRSVVSSADVFIPERDTVMKPHLLRALLIQGLFADYEDAAAWLRAQGKPVQEVSKPTSAEAVALIRAAGGTAVLAHPGYYFEADAERELRAMIATLADAGLAGVETDYPYAGSNRRFPDRSSEKEAVDLARHLAREFGLQSTRGSDAHTVAQMEAFAQRPPHKM